MPLQWRPCRAWGQRAVGLRQFPAPLAGALVGVLIGPLDVGLVGVALPRIGESLGAELAGGQLVLLTYVAPLALAYVPAGLIADRTSPVLVLRLGLLLFALGALTVAAAPALLVLLAGRALQGLGAAAAVSGGQAIAFSALGARRAGRGLGLVHSSVALGMLAGPILGGLLLERAPWQGLFVAEIPIALGGALIARASVPAPRGAARPPLRDLTRASLLRPLALALAVFVAMAANMFLMPYLLQRPFGLGPSSAGLLLAIVPLVILFGAPTGGDLADRYGSRLPAAIGAALIALGIAGFGLTAATGSIAVVLVALITYGLGAALFQAPNNRTVLAAAPPGGISLASGLLGASRQAGQAIGVIAAGTLLAAGGRADVLASYVSTFLVLAALAALVALAVTIERKPGPATAVRVHAAREEVS